MKKIILKLILATCIVIAGYFLYLQEDNYLNDLAVKNIEALAGNEYEEDYYCYGTGSVDCHGNKVEMKIEGFRL